MYGLFLFTSLDKAKHIIVAFVEFRALARADFNVNKQTINIANISNSSQEYRKYKTGTASLKNAVYYPLLILSINSSDVSISILEKSNHFLPKSLIEAPI